VPEPASCLATATPGSGACRWFLGGAGLAFLFPGLAKAFSAVGADRALDVADPIIGLPFRQVMLGVGLIDLPIACCCLGAGKRWLWLLAVARLSTNFVIYRLGLWWIGWHRPCRCLGNLTGALHISPTTADYIMKGVLAYLLIGSYWLLWRQWQALRAAYRGSLLGQSATA